MKDPVRIQLHPLGVAFEVERGTPLQDVLFEYGVEFPCGGNAQCEGCKVKLLAGTLPVTDEQRNMLTPEEMNSGWRLACCCAANEDITLELAQWEVQILTDETRTEIVPREGLGVAVDLGTTTLVAQLLDLSTGNVLGVRTGLNEQGRFGADVMRRVSYAIAEKGQQTLEAIIRRQIGEMVADLLENAHAKSGALQEVVIVGNTVMHHLFCGVSLEPLSHYPFEPVDDGEKHFSPGDVGWNLGADTPVRFLPCLGGFVGSDILAGILATGLYRSQHLMALIDLGTNGEVVVGNRDRMLCCSTAAGPAFEGSQISMGMRATTGAIAEVRARGSEFECRILGKGLARGICGSGLVDAVAAALENGKVAPSGRLAVGNASFVLCEPVSITQTDIRQLQVAKAAIAAGVRILLDELGASSNDIEKVHLAGAFGNYVSRSSANRIGLLHFPPDKVHSAGNTALHGAKVALLNRDDSLIRHLRQMTRHIPLNAHARFQEIFVDEMPFPDASPQV